MIIKKLGFKVMDLKDNSIKEFFLSEHKDDCKNLRRIAGKSIGELQKESKILVFPPLDRTDDGIGNSAVFKMVESGEKFFLETGNVMGFIGCGSTKVNIFSRFTDSQVDGGQGDFFLHYMLEKVCHVNLSALESSRERERIFDFLPFLFPSYLFAALSQGLYKEYQTRFYNDSNVRGVVDVNAHIRRNIPANGRIAYRTREYCFDNPVMQLVRHTIEYLRASSIFKNVLSCSEEMKEAVGRIEGATPSYNRMERSKILSKTVKPIKSPYFFKYCSLQKICRMILLREKIKYDLSANKMYGILFDGAWLWEEYLATLLKKKGYVHPENKEKNGGFSPFEKFSDEFCEKKVPGVFYPDFYKPKEGVNRSEHKADIILDAKYKIFDMKNPPADDLHQMIAYIHVMDAGSGFFVYPSKENETGGGKVWCLKPFAEKRARLGTKAFFIPQNAESYGEFRQRMEVEEERLCRAEV